MPVITLFSGSFCGKESVVKKLTENTGYNVITDDDLFEDVRSFADIPEKSLRRAFSGKPSVFNQFTHEKERAESYLKLAVAKTLKEDNLLITGFAVHLIPSDLNHILKVCLIADMKFRIAQAGEMLGLSEKEAKRMIRKQDEEKAAWVNEIRNQKDPWDASLYDILIPMEKTGAEGAISLIEKHLSKDILHVSGTTMRDIDSFITAAEVEVELARNGHHVNVTGNDGIVTAMINKNVINLGKLEQEIKSIAEKIPGVKDVNIKVGKKFHQSDIYRKYDFQMPSKLLLVDDEREFVQTLSKRLVMREMGSVVAYDGESALDLVQNDEPEVMILDLRMPGIDGMEVLRRVKRVNPEIEVVILTGHGSETDEKEALGLGAFAYLQKPVEFDRLIETLKKANEKVQEKKKAS